MNHTQTKVIGVGSADGHFQYLHVPSMKKMFSLEEKQNSILCCEFSKTGEHFATAGKDCNIRVYDERKTYLIIIRNEIYQHTAGKC